MFYILKYIVTILLLFECVCSFAQQNPAIDIRFRNITTKDGLSSNSVQACYLDSYGFMWIGTQAGLNRYDGNTIKVFDHNNSDSTSIGNGFIWYIHEDDERYLWIGTNEGGLNKYNPRTEKFTRYKNDPADMHSISDNTVFCIIEDNDKDLWLATLKGIDKFDRKTGKVKRYTHSPNDTNTISYNGRATIFKDRNGNIFIGTKFGINKYNKEKDNFQRIRLTENDNFAILCISQDSAGIFWIGTQERGIFKYDESSGRIENIMPEKGNPNSLASTAIRAIIHCENGLIWIGHLTEKAGLDVFDTKENIYYNFKRDKSDDKSIALDVMWDIYKDRYGNMWVCTNGGGVSFYSEHANKFKHINKLLGEGSKRGLKVVWGILYALDRFWCYTEGSIITFSKTGKLIKEYDRKLMKLRMFTPLYYGKTSGRLYTGDLDKSLTYYDSTNDSFIKCPIIFKDTTVKHGVTNAMLEDKEGNIWLGTNAGLVKLDKNFKEVDICNNYDSSINKHVKNWSRGIYIDSENNLWFCGDGLIKLNLNTGKFIRYTADEKSDKFPSGDRFANSFYEDGKGSLWISHDGSGFDRHDLRNNTFKHYNVSNGLKSNYLFCILPDNAGNLWMSSTKGIIRFSTNDEKITYFDAVDGVQGDEFNSECYSFSNDGMITMGGTNGINYFYPDEITSNPHIPPVAITSFKTFLEETELPHSITFTDEIILPYNNNFFSIGFASLDYTNPSKNQYAYMLEGIDKDWILSGNKYEANYTNIEHGDYIFKVKSSNNDGIWNENARALKITVTPPWWHTWWFRGCAAIIILGFTGIVINRKMKALRRENEMQEEFTMKLIESHEEERKKLSAELHDSLGQDLIIIKNSANMALNKLKAEPDAAKFLNQISEISSSALSSVRAISHNLRPAELDKIGLTETIKSIIDTVSSSSEIEFKSDIDNIDGVFEKNSEVNICRIVQECLNNILKHSGAKNAFISIEYADGFVQTTVKDNGAGFDYDKIMNNPKGLTFGLKGISERVRIMEGTIKILSEPGKGTEITITIPVFKNHS